jgi:DNA-binding PadR family transcriptional regulator
MVADGVSYGFDIMEATGLPSGTVYPALRRLESTGLIASFWEKESKAFAERRPARKYYRATSSGRSSLKAAADRYPLLRRLSVPKKARELG